MLWHRQKLLSWRYVGEEGAQSFRKSQVSNDSVAQLLIWKLCQHGRLYSRHDFARFRAQHGEADNAIIARAHQCFHETFGLVRCRGS